MGKIHLVLIDSQAASGQICRHFLENEEDIEIVGECGTLGDAINLVGKRSPDVVIMDTLYKYTNGLELTQLFKTYSPKTRYIILTRLIDQQHIQELLEAGVSAYVAQNDMTESLVPAIRSAMEGKVYLSPTVAKHYSGRSDDKNT